jgi:hypothetical protein
VALFYTSSTISSENADASKHTPMHPFVRREIAHTHTPALATGICSSFDPARRMAEHSVDNASFERALPNFQTPSRQKAHGVGLQEIKHPTRLSRSSKPYGEEVEIVLRKRIQRRVAKMEWEVALPPRSSDITGGPRQGVGEIVIETAFFATSQRAPAARVRARCGWTTSGFNALARSWFISCSSTLRTLWGLRAPAAHGRARCGWTISGAKRARVQETVQRGRNKKDTPGALDTWESTRNAPGCTRRRD